MSAARDLGSTGPIGQPSVPQPEEVSAFLSPPVPSFSPSRTSFTYRGPPTGLMLPSPSAHLAVTVGALRILLGHHSRVYLMPVGASHFQQSRSPFVAPSSSPLVILLITLSLDIPPSDFFPRPIPDNGWRMLTRLVLFPILSDAAPNPFRRRHLVPLFSIHKHLATRLPRSRTSQSVPTASPLPVLSLLPPQIASLRGSLGRRLSSYLRPVRQARRPTLPPGSLAGLPQPKPTAVSTPSRLRQRVDDGDVLDTWNRMGNPA